MALQGTLDNFSLPDVLRLLASARKSGQLELTADEGTASIWVADGLIVETVSSLTAEAIDVVSVIVQLLGLTHGEFVFEEGIRALNAGVPADIDKVLLEAEEQFRELQAAGIDHISLDQRVVLAPTLATKTVTLNRSQWSMVAAIADGVNLGALGERFDQDAISILGRVNDLCELGVVELGSAPTDGDFGGQFEPAVFERITFIPPVTDHEPFEPDIYERPSVIAPAPLTIVEPVDLADAQIDSFDPQSVELESERWSQVGRLPSAPVELVGFESDPIYLTESLGAEGPIADPPESDAVEIARQLSNLSPKAAKAVAAAARATTEDEREAALAGIDEQDESISRELLLKFLGSLSS
ncbi:MAG: DUF4388 domain-containing protein [Actinomycetes bacterium]